MQQLRSTPKARMTTTRTSAAHIESNSNNRLLQSILNKDHRLSPANQFQSNNMARNEMFLPPITAYNMRTVNHDPTANKMGNWQGPNPNVRIYGSGKDPPRHGGRHDDELVASKRSGDHLERMEFTSKRTLAAFGNVASNTVNNNRNIANGLLRQYPNRNVGNQPSINVAKPYYGDGSGDSANVEDHNSLPFVPAQGPNHITHPVGYQPPTNIPHFTEPHVGYPRERQLCCCLKDCRPDLAAEIMVLIPHMDEIEATVYEKPYYRDTLRYVICVECNYTIFADVPGCRQLTLHTEMFCHTTHKFSLILLDTAKLSCATCRVTSQKDISFFVVESLVHHQRNHHPYIENPNSEVQGSRAGVHHRANVLQQQLNLPPADEQWGPLPKLIVPQVKANVRKPNSKASSMAPATDRLACTMTQALYNVTHNPDHQKKTHPTQHFRNGKSKQSERSTQLNHDVVKSTQHYSQIPHSDDAEIPNILDQGKTNAQSVHATTQRGLGEQTNDSRSIRNALELSELPRAIQNRTESKTSSNSNRTTHEPHTLAQTFHSTIVHNDSQVEKQRDNMPDNTVPKATSMLSDVTKVYAAEMPGVKGDFQGRMKPSGNRRAIAAWVDSVIDPEKVITIQPETPRQMTDQQGQHINSLDKRDGETCPAVVASNHSLVNEASDTHENGTGNGHPPDGTVIGNGQRHQFGRYQQHQQERSANHNANPNITKGPMRSLSASGQQPSSNSSIPPQTCPVPGAHQQASDVPTPPPTGVQHGRYEQGTIQRKSDTLPQTSPSVTGSREDNTLETHPNDDLANGNSSGVNNLQQAFPGVQILQQADMSFRSHQVATRIASKHGSIETSIQEQNTTESINLPKNGALNATIDIEKAFQYEPDETDSQVVAGSQGTLNQNQPNAGATEYRDAISHPRQDPTPFSTYAKNPYKFTEPLVTTVNGMQSPAEVEVIRALDQLNDLEDEYSLSSNDLVIDLEAESEHEQDPYKVFLFQNWVDKEDAARTIERASPATTVGYDVWLRDDLESSEHIYRPCVEDVTPEGSVLNFASVIEEPIEHRLGTSPMALEMPREHEVLIAELSAMTDANYPIRAPSLLARHEPSSDGHASSDDDDCMIIEPP